MNIRNGANTRVIENNVIFNMLKNLYIYSKDVRDKKVTFDSKNREKFEADIAVILRSHTPSSPLLNPQSIVNLWSMFAYCGYTHTRIPSILYPKLFKLTHQTLSSFNARDISTLFSVFFYMRTKWEKFPLRFRQDLFSRLQSLLLNKAYNGTYLFNSKLTVSLLKSFAELFRKPNCLNDIPSQLKTNIFIGLLKLVQLHQGEMNTQERIISHNALVTMRIHWGELEKKFELHQILHPRGNKTLWETYQNTINVLPDTYRQFQIKDDFDTASLIIKHFAPLYAYSLHEFKNHKSCAISCALYQWKGQTYLLLTPAYRKDRTPNSMDAFIKYWQMLQENTNVSHAEKSAWHTLLQSCQEKKTIIQVISGVSEDTNQALALTTLTYHDQNINLKKKGYPCGEPVLYVEIEKLFQQKDIQVMGTANFLLTFSQLPDGTLSVDQFDVQNSCKSRCQYVNNVMGLLKATNHVMPKTEGQKKNHHETSHNYVKRKLSQPRVMTIAPKNRVDLAELKLFADKQAIKEPNGWIGKSSPMDDDVSAPQLNHSREPDVEIPAYVPQNKSTLNPHAKEFISSQKPLSLNPDANSFMPLNRDAAPFIPYPNTRLFKPLNSSGNEEFKQINSVDNKNIKAYVSYKP